MYVLYQTELIDEDKNTLSSLVTSDKEIFNDKIIDLQKELFTIEYEGAILEITIKEFFIEC